MNALGVLIAVFGSGFLLGMGVHGWLYRATEPPGGERAPETKREDRPYWGHYDSYDGDRAELNAAQEDLCKRYENSPTGCFVDGKVIYLNQMRRK